MELLSNNHARKNPSAAKDSSNRTGKRGFIRCDASSMQCRVSAMSCGVAAMSCGEGAMTGALAAMRGESALEAGIAFSEALCMGDKEQLRGRFQSVFAPDSVGFCVLTLVSPGRRR